MAKPKELKFKPHVGLFFQFIEKIRNNPSKLIAGTQIYGNDLYKRVKFDNLPESILVVDEKRNHVKFITHENISYWTLKSQIEPLNLPTYNGNPIPLLEEFKKFLVYCTDTKIVDFRIDTMTMKAMDLLPKLNSMIEDGKMKIINTK